MPVEKRNAIVGWGSLALILMIGLGYKLSWNPLSQGDRVPAFASKSRSFVSTVISVPESLGSETYKLIGKIEVKRDLADLAIEWRLPEGVSLVAGEPNDSYPGAKSGDTFETEVRLKAPSTESLQQVFLSAYTHINGVRMGQTGVIGSEGKLKTSSSSFLTKGEQRRNQMIRE